MTWVYKHGDDGAVRVGWVGPDGFVAVETVSCRENAADFVAYMNGGPVRFIPGAEPAPEDGSGGSSVSPAALEVMQGAMAGALLSISDTDGIREFLRLGHPSVLARVDAAVLMASVSGLRFDADGPAGPVSPGRGGSEFRLFEVRDRMTTIAAFAVRLDADDPIVKHAGWVGSPVLLGYADGSQFRRDPSHWTGPSRAMPAAHRILIDGWDRFPSGSLIDVEYELGESPDQKDPEIGV